MSENRFINDAINASAETEGDRDKLTGMVTGGRFPPLPEQCATVGRAMHQF